MGIMAGAFPTAAGVVGTESFEIGFRFGPSGGVDGVEE